MQPQTPILPTVINLPGPARLIRKVDLVYSKLIGGGTAVVTLQGRKL